MGRMGGGAGGVGGNQGNAAGGDSKDIRRRVSHNEGTTTQLLINYLLFQ